MMEVTDHGATSGLCFAGQNNLTRCQLTLLSPPTNIISSTTITQKTKESQESPLHQSLHMRAPYIWYSRQNEPTPCFNIATQRITNTTFDSINQDDEVARLN